MFCILPDESGIPEAPSAHVVSLDRAIPKPRSSREPSNSTRATIDRLQAAFDEDAVDMVVGLILGDSPHGARIVADVPTCLTCQVKWPCPPTIVLIKAAARGTTAVQAAEGTFLGGAS